MWSLPTFKCLMDEHVSSAFTYQGTEYGYCVRCGHVTGKTNGASVLSEDICSTHGKTEHPAEMVSI